MFRDNIKGTVDYFATHIYPRPALQPEFQWLAANFSSTPIAAPAVHFIQTGRMYVALNETSESAMVHQVVIYKWLNDAWTVSRVLPRSGEITNKDVGLELENGRYAATLFDRFGREGPHHYFDVLKMKFEWK